MRRKIQQEESSKENTQPSKVQVCKFNKRISRFSYDRNQT